MSCLAEIPALLCFGFVLLSFASTGDTQNSTSPTESTSSTKSTSLTTAKDAEIKPKCVFCTYNNAGDGTIDYACVSDPFSHASSRNMTCNFTSHSCIIRVVYEYLDFKKIQSLVRGCEPTKNQSYECDKYVPPTCLRECRSNFCNSIFGDIKNPSPSTLTNNGDTQNYTSPKESTSSTKSATSQESTSPTTAKADIKPKCVFCTYNFAGDGTTDYTCVSDPFSHASTSNQTCDFTSKSCIIRVVYEYPDFKKIQSLVRGCELTKNQKDECDTYTPATCLRECRSNLCNSIFGDIQNPPPSTVTNGGIRLAFFGILFLCLGLQHGF